MTDPAWWIRCSSCRALERDIMHQTLAFPPAVPHGKPPSYDSGEPDVVIPPACEFKGQAALM